MEEKYTSLLFAKDGETYEFAGKNCVAMGGAYIVDKPTRLANNWGWREDDQPSAKIKNAWNTC